MGYVRCRNESPLACVNSNRSVDNLSFTTIDTLYRAKYGQQMKNIESTHISPLRIILLTKTNPVHLNNISTIWYDTAGSQSESLFVTCYSNLMPNH